MPQPFLVIATQNPAGASGTQLLPDSQMDRFMVRLSIGYPAPADEMAMVRRRQGGALLEGVRPVLELNGLLALRAQAGQVYVSDEVLDYIVRLVGATRSHPMILQGASPRATLALTAMAKAAALVRGRDYVLPEDVSLVFGDVVPHRLLLSPRAEADRSFDPASELLERVPADKRAALTGVLSRDPRPPYQHDPERVYGLDFAGVNIRFTVDGDTLTVRAVERMADKQNRTNR